MAFMCRSAGVQRWSAGAAKDPLFQTPTVLKNCKGVSTYLCTFSIAALSQNICFNSHLPKWFWYVNKPNYLYIYTLFIWSLIICLLLCNATIWLIDWIELNFTIQ